MDVYEIECVLTDEHGLISQVGVKGYGMHSVALISDLIKQQIFCFFTYRNGNRTDIFANFTTNKIPFLVTDPDEINVNDLDFLPKISTPLLKQLVEPLR
jgi:hypothetical protein